ncbi:portal protein [Bacillus phage Megatron]|uniref:Portal protein n=3 Tax=Wphvirus TaxID=1922327 RepID=A0A024B3S8_9CAUD|nr:portal protein [Bacillus phage Megatron]YP_009280888.1 portal protein [Bacillus phage SageFayge]YP_009284412.1 portal protein [Bacillus phage NotTheCreek]ASR78323.1 portal protein [Bacillus phage PPIsBest]QDH49360.1 portal protein [Bacillus phage Phireball]ULF48995.1 portal protein [Bacillus phage Darren]ULF49291.1 portal protein [Bacillus phage MrBubbles]AHZ10663.1 portal protein [Bacillus phage Megatron]
MNPFKWFRKKKPTTLSKMDILNPEDMGEFSVMINGLEQEVVSKSGDKKDIGRTKGYEEPYLTSMTVNPDYKEAPSRDGDYRLLDTLKLWSRKNIIVNAIINTRVNQVSMFCTPSRYSTKGVGYEVRLKDPLKNPSKAEEAKIKEIETFLEYTGVDNGDLTRDTFRTFIKKITRDRLIYDKVNFELIYNKEKQLARFAARDASTIYTAVDSNGKLPKGKDAYKYVQIIDSQKVASFKSNEMAWEVHNPRTDITVGRYGYSELEICLQHLQYHENTELFNARYFAQGGTTRGLLHIKTGQEQSRSALQSFRREWQSMFSGVNGAWKIPVVSAEDVNFINMTQSSKDMEFERWLNYLINVMCSIFAIDPSEINFPNRGGATGSSGSSLNETSAKEKNRISRDKGLEPLLKFIEDTINKYIIKQFGDEYLFQFVGGDAATEKEALELLELRTQVGLTFNEARAILGYGAIEGGDVINSPYHVQSKGQIMQEKMIAQQQAAEGQSDDKQMSEMKQQGMNGKSDAVNGNAGKPKQDGQVKGVKSGTAMKQGGKSENKATVNEDAKRGKK